MSSYSSDLYIRMYNLGMIKTTRIHSFQGLKAGDRMLVGTVFRQPQCSLNPILFRVLEGPTSSKYNVISVEDLSTGVVRKMEYEPVLVVLKLV